MSRLEDADKLLDGAESCQEAAATFHAGGDPRAMGEYVAAIAHGILALALIARAALERQEAKEP